MSDVKKTLTILLARGDEYSNAELCRDISNLMGLYTTNDETIEACETLEKYFAEWLDNYDPTV